MGATETLLPGEVSRTRSLQFQSLHLQLRLRVPRRQPPFFTFLARSLERFLLFLARSLEHFIQPLLIL